MISSDLILTDNGWMELLINGSTEYSITGMQTIMNTAFPNKNIEVSMAYGELLKIRDTNFERELTHPYVVVSCRFHYPNKNMGYWKNIIPSTDNLGWVTDLHIRYDVWARNPPEVRDVIDEVYKGLMVNKYELWKNTRTKMEVEYEIENYIDKVEGIPIMEHRSVNTILSVFQIKEADE